MEKAYVCLGSDWDGDGIADGDGDERIRMIRLIVILQHFYSILVTLLLWPLHEMLQVYFPFFFCVVSLIGLVRCVPRIRRICRIHRIRTRM